MERKGDLLPIKATHLSIKGTDFEICNPETIENDPCKKKLIVKTSSVITVSSESIDNEPTLLMTTMYGESMSPKIEPGDLILIKNLSKPDIILWGEAYVIKMDHLANGHTLVRRLHVHEDSSKIILRADNLNYIDIIISRSEILGLSLVMGRVTRIHY